MFFLLVFLYLKLYVQEEKLGKLKSRLRELGEVVSEGEEGEEEDGFLT